MNEMRIMKSVRQVSFFCALIVRYEYRAIFFQYRATFFSMTALPSLVDIFGVY